MLSAAILADYLNYNLTFRDHLLLYVAAGLASVGFAAFAVAGRSRSWQSSMGSASLRGERSVQDRATGSKLSCE